MTAATAESIIEALGLQPHPEGGHFRELHRETAPDGGRGAITSILFLLRAGEVSAWHRVDATEIWYFHAGAPLRLRVGSGESILGRDPTQGQMPQAVVPAHAWQSAESLGDWTLVGCAVAPAFVFDGFEMAPPGWSPTPGGD